MKGEIPTLKKLQAMDDDAIVAALTKVRGIGRWTVEMLLMFRLGRPDVFPIADFGIRKGYARLFHAKKKRDEMPDVDAMVRRAGCLTDRKLRQYMAACCRLHADAFFDPRLAQGLAIVDQCADDVRTERKAEAIWNHLVTSPKPLPAFDYRHRSCEAQI